MSSLEEHLADYKNSDDLARLVALVDDLHAMQVLALWPYVDKTWKPSTDLSPSSPEEKWAWLWDGCKYNNAAFADMVELPITALARKMTKLKAARLVFPDGTVDERALALVRNYIKREMK